MRSAVEKAEAREGGITLIRTKEALVRIEGESLWMYPYVPISIIRCQLKLKTPLPGPCLSRISCSQDMHMQGSRKKITLERLCPYI